MKTTDTKPDVSREVADLLEQIAFGGQTGIETARRLESAVLEQFPDADDDERFEQLLHILASYNPAGGTFLHDSFALIEEARRVLPLLKSGPRTTR